MFNRIKKWFRKEQREAAPIPVETPKSLTPPKYSKETHKSYYEIMYQNDKKGQRAIVRFYAYDNKSPVVEEVIEESNLDTLKMKVARLVEQRMSKQKR